MAKTDYSNETKAAVMAALLAGQSVPEIAEKYNIPESTIKNWKYRKVSLVEPKKKEEIGDLLFDYLRTMLGTLKIQAEHFRDKAWLTEQNAADLAVLHGVGADKTIRLLEALGRSDEQEPAE